MSYRPADEQILVEKSGIDYIGYTWSKEIENKVLGHVRKLILEIDSGESLWQNDSSQEKLYGFWEEILGLTEPFFIPKEELESDGEKDES